MARKKNGKPLARCKCCSYIKLAIPPAAYGILLVMVPVMIVNFFICAFITGSVLNYDTSVYNCSSQTTSSCKLTLFDNILATPGDSLVNYDTLRTGRCGTALLMFGLYLLYLGLTILVPDKSESVIVNCILTVIDESAGVI
jgi:hypothetical protein